MRTEKIIKRNKQLVNKISKFRWKRQNYKVDFTKNWKPNPKQETSIPVQKTMNQMIGKTI